MWQYSTALCGMWRQCHVSRRQIDLQSITCLQEERSHIENERFVIGREGDPEIAHNRQ